MHYWLTKEWKKGRKRRAREEEETEVTDKRKCKQETENRAAILRNEESEVHLYNCQ